MDDINNNEHTHQKDYQIQLYPIKQKLQDVRDITVDNIEKVLVRGDKLEKLVDNTESLNDSSIKFYKSSKNLRNKMIYKRVRWFILCIMAFVLLFYFLAYSICGNPNLHNCN